MDEINITVGRLRVGAVISVATALRPRLVSVRALVFAAVSAVVPADFVIVTLTPSRRELVTNSISNEFCANTLPVALCELVTFDLIISTPIFPIVVLIGLLLTVVVHVAEQLFATRASHVRTQRVFQANENCHNFLAGILFRELEKVQVGHFKLIHALQALGVPNTTKEGVLTGIVLRQSAARNEILWKTTLRGVRGPDKGDQGKSKGKFHGKTLLKFLTTA
mmetsp:Transcript_22565/g.46882  ORF Transcript_22565/g.46882 Transcript_22565/m.46882 type:complete len:222 (+) Transcript_22565:1733-2398(+)